MSDRLKAQFATFHTANPHIYELYVKFAREAKNRNFKKFGISAITERIRWEVATTTTDQDFKISNNHRAFYARLLNDTVEFKDFFRTKPQKDY